MADNTLHPRSVIPIGNKLNVHVQQQFPVMCNYIISSSNDNLLKQ